MKKINLIFSLVVFAFLYSNAQTIDSTFGSNGYIPYGATGNSENNKGTGNKIAIQTDGKIVVAVDKSDPNDDTDLWFYTYRYNQDGTPDESFGDNGVSKIFAGSQSINKDVKIQSDGKIVIVGETEYCTGGICGAPQFIMMRIKTNGEIDSTFGTYGKILSDDVFGTSGLFAKPERLVLTPNNKFMIAGRGIAGKPFIGRVNNDGSMDGTFGTNGIFSDTAYATLVDLTIDELGNSYGLMIKYNQWDTINASDSYIIKLNANGILDNSFGIGGRKLVNTAAYEKPTSISIRSDHKIVVVGHSQPVYLTGFNDGYGETNVGYIMILNSDGSASSILPQGFSTFKIPDDTTTFIHNILLTAGDKMLISGRTITKIAGNFHEKAFIAYLDANGNLETTFNNTGFMKFDLGLHSTIGSLACFLDLKLLPNQKLLACGYRNPISFNTSKSLVLLQLKNTAIVDPTEIFEKPVLSNDYNIYPNPASNFVSIVSCGNETSDLKITLFNIQGQLILNQTFSIEKSMILNVENISKGMYLLKIESNYKSVTKKLIIK